MQAICIFAVADDARKSEGVRFAPAIALFIMPLQSALVNRDSDFSANELNDANISARGMVRNRH